MFHYQEHRMIRNPPLSTGGFGAIYAYQPKNSTGKKWVVKEVYCKDPSQIQSFFQEIVLSFNHNSPFILSSQGFNLVQNEQGKWIIRIKMPRMKQSLRDYISNPTNKPFTTPEAVKLLYRLAYGLKQLQNVKISHRDLKPDNILLDDNNDPYLADLGLARLVVEETEYSQINLAGTPGYFPPETNHAKVTKKKDLHKIDLWNLGIIMYEVCTFSDFYLKSEVEKKKYLSEQLPIIFDAVTKKYGKKFCEIIQGLLCADPDKRMKVDTVLEILEKNFLEYLESTFDVLADNIKKSHQKVIIDKLSKSAEVRANIYKERFRFAQSLASQYGKDFVFDIDEELAIKARDPSNLTPSAIENLNRGLSEILNEAPADLVSSLKVDLSWCESLNDNSLKLNFKDLKKGNNIQKLTLNFAGCSQITDNGLNFLTHDNLGGLTKLKNLNLDFSGCRWIKKSGLEQLFGNLKTLSLKGLSIRAHECSEMILKPDEVDDFSKSIKGIPSLEKLRLDISSNSKMPKQTRNSLRQSLGHIKNLDVI